MVDGVAENGRPRSRVPWFEPAFSNVPEFTDEHVLVASYGDPWAHAVRICHRRGGSGLPVVEYDRGGDFLKLDSWLSDSPPESKLAMDPAELDDFVADPALVYRNVGSVVCDDPVALARVLCPELFTTADVDQRITEFRTSLLDAVYELGQMTDQATYEDAHAALATRVRELDETLQSQRFLGGEDPDFVDVLLYVFSVRLDPVYYELYKATIGRLADFRALEGHAQDLHERPEFQETTRLFSRIKQEHYQFEPVLNPKKIVPAGGIPDLHAPHFRGWKFDTARQQRAGTEEDQSKRRTEGEWVRPQSRERDWIRPKPDAKYPAEAGRYHLYAPYNCPWSHRALLGRAVKGLEDVVGASVVYFRRDPDHGWQFNPDVPGCTADLAGDRRYVRELYESVGSDEKSVPVLWDAETETIVSNESAEILRMFDGAFGELAARDLELYPDGYGDEIDRINEAVYQRINNGAYKAGFAKSQAAYELAFDRYFRALDWLEELLGEVEWIAGTPAASEADLRLFPTVFRHDAVYYSRFKLNERKIADFPRLSDWLDRMSDVPGVADASNLDHARNGYFGRTGSEIVPAGPIPLGLSPRDFSRDTWLNQQ